MDNPWPEGVDACDAKQAKELGIPYQGWLYTIWDQLGTTTDAIESR